MAARHPFDTSFVAYFLCTQVRGLVIREMFFGKKKKKATGSFLVINRAEASIAQPSYSGTYASNFNMRLKFGGVVAHASAELIEKGIPRPKRAHLFYLRGFPMFRDIRRS